MADELATGERWAAEHKLLRRADFQACYKNGRRQGGRFSTLFYRPNDLGHPRLGITATRKLGKAVLRQKAKRRVREIYRRWPDRHRMAALDLVVHFKPSITEAPFDDLRRDLLRQLALASGLIESRGRAPRSGRTRRPEERS